MNLRLLSRPCFALNRWTFATLIGTPPSPLLELQIHRGRPSCSSVPAPTDATHGHGPRHTVDRAACTCMLAYTLLYHLEQPIGHRARRASAQWPMGCSGWVRARARACLSRCCVRRCVNRTPAQRRCTRTCGVGRSVSLYVIHVSASRRGVPVSCKCPVVQSTQGRLKEAILEYVIFQGSSLSP